MSAPADSCSSPILEPDRSALLQEALADSQLQAVKSQLESRGFGIKTDEAQAVQLAGGQQLLIPFGEDAHLVWTRTNGQAVALGLIRQGNKTLNISTTGEERVVRFLPVQKVEKLLRKLREKPKFQEFEGKLAQKGKRVGKVRALLDETNKIAILGIANEGDEEKIAHQVRIKVKPDKDDEPEEDAEPAIQATACGQATGEAVPAGAKMQPLALPPGEGDIGGGYEGPQICTSQWGYDYLCISRTPAISLSTASLTLPQTFITQQVQASFVIWNAGGGTLSGTVSVPAPFSIVSGSSFSLLPGQPQEVVVKFSSGTAGSFSQNLTITSNAGTKLMPVSGVAHKVTFSPATLDFGSVVTVMFSQCNPSTGLIEGIYNNNDFNIPPPPPPSPYYPLMKSMTQSSTPICRTESEVVGQLEKKLLIKNEGITTVELIVNASTQFIITSNTFTLSPGQSQEVTIRFNPTTSEDFNGSIQVALQNGQGKLSAPITGVMHTVSVDAARLDFDFVFVNAATDRKLKVANHGVTTVSVSLSTSAPFSIVSPNPFTLAPNQNQEVTVRVNPTVKGTFSGAVRFLFNGVVSKEFIAEGTAVTFEDFLLAMLNAHNTAAQAGDYPILFIRDKARMTNLLLSGFENLTAGQLDELLNQAATLPLANNDNQPSLEEMINALSPCVQQAIDDLASKLDAPDFDNAVQMWRSSCSAFDRLVIALEDAANQGYLTFDLASDPVELLRYSISYFSYLEQDTRKAALAISTYELQQPGVAIMIGLIHGATGVIMQQIIDFGITGEPLPNQSPAEFAINFAMRVEIMIIAFTSCTRCNTFNALSHLLGRLSGLVAAGEAVYRNMIPLESYRDYLQGIVSELATAIRLFSNDWELIDYSRPVTTKKGSTEIDVIAVKESNSLGTVVAFIEVKSGSISRSDNDLSMQVSRYAEYARQVMDNCAKGRGCEVKANLYVAVFVFHNYTSPADANWLANLPSTSGVPFLVIYCVANCYTPYAQYAIAHNLALSDSQALAIACDMGYCPMQAQVQDINSVSFTDIDPIIIAPTEPVTSPSQGCSGLGEYSTCY